MRLEPLEDRRLLALVTVTTLDDTVDLGDGVTSLREAIFAANTVPGADTIEFAPSLTANGPAKILLTHGELAITDSLTIDGPSAELLTIDASGNDPTPELNNGDGSRVFFIRDESVATFLDVSIGGVALTGADSHETISDGGAIRNLENLTLNDAKISGNATRGRGGGIYHQHGLLRVINCTISSNKILVGYGGAIYAFRGDVSIENSLIENNEALGSGTGGGGGVRVYQGDLVVTNSQILNNKTGHRGGGIAVREGNLEILNSTVSGNQAAYFGGGIDVEVGNATITDTLIASNSSAARGGGINVNQGSAAIRGSRISSNLAAGSGGGIYLSGFSLQPNLKMEDTVVDGNTAAGTANFLGGDGGGISVGGSVEIIHCTISGNTAAGNGGGIRAAVGGLFVISDSSIGENHAAGNGGGVNLSGSSGGGRGDMPFETPPMYIDKTAIEFNTAGGSGGGLIYRGTRSLTLSNSSVSSNRSETTGGGIASVPTALVNLPLAELLMINSTITGNRSNGDGGGVFVQAASSVQNATFNFSTITANRSDDDGVNGGAGGGVFVARGTARFGNTIVAANNSSAGLGPDLTGSIGAVFEPRYSLIGTNAGNGLASAPIGSPGVNGNLIGGADGETIDPLLSPLADNGGPTLTHALLPGSPAINAGDLNAVAGVDGVPLVDQRGEPFGRIVGGRIDIGAFEYQTPTDLNLLVDTLEDESDGDYARGDLSLREAIELTNASKYAGVIDTIRFDPALTAGGPATILLTHGELAITDSLTIDGPGAELLTIDASGNDPTPDVNNSDGSRVFRIDDNQLSTLIDVAIQSLAITGGDMAIVGSLPLNNGGAIFARENLVLSHVAVVGNASQWYGGGVYVEYGSLRVSESTISDNYAGARGGGIYAFRSQLVQSSSKCSGIRSDGCSFGIRFR